MELEPRNTAPAHATGTVAFVPFAAIAPDATFRLREEDDVSALAASMGRLGQLEPVELRPRPGAGEEGPRYQLVTGFRRVAALRLLRRERVLARIHGELSDEDAWAVALGQALLSEPLHRDALRALRERLAASGVAPWADELVDEALVRAPVEPELRERFFEFLGGLPPDVAAGEVGGVEPEAPGAEEPGAAPAEEGPVEMTPEELAGDLASRLYQLNADLIVAFEAWAELPAEGRRAIVEQARWISELLPLLLRAEEAT